MCSSIGPYKNQQTLNRLLHELASSLKHTDLRTDTKVNTMYLVVSKTFSSAKQATENMKKMQASGIKDIATLNIEGKHRISLGLYNRQSLAKNRVVEITNKGYEVELQPRETKRNNYWADVTYLAQSVERLENVIPEKNRSACNKTIELSMLKK